MSGARERDLDVGPMLPATMIRLPVSEKALSAARLAILAPSLAISGAKPLQPYSC